MLHLPEQLAGVKVLPVEPGGKLPALSYGWQVRATDDAEQVAEWSRAMPDLNWGVAAGPSGLLIFDIDPQGLDTWRAMQEADPELKQAVANSFTVKTPRGGFHHYFKGYGPTTASAIAPGIDTRGGYLDERTGKLKSIGYVVLPGSKTAVGEYVALGGSLDFMPEAVRRIVPEKKRGAMLGLTRDPAKDQPRNVQWAKDLLNSYVKEGRVSVEGHGGNNTAFQVAASILDKAISPALAFELLDELWNPHCSPPWEDWELEGIVENAAKYGEETEGGSKGFEDNQSAFAGFVGYDGADGAADEVPHAKRRRERVQWIDDFAAAVENPSWLLPGILPARGVTMLYGASGSYKSFLALDWASCLAHGHPGQWNAPPVCNDVLYFAGEAPIGTAKQRRPAWVQWQEVKTPHRLAIFPRVPFLGDGDGWNGIKQDVEELGMTPKLIVIDTLSRLLTGFDENSSKDATKTTTFLEELAAYYECAVLVIHHTGKDENRGARGSSVWFANVDSVLSTSKKGQGTYLRVRKHKDADAPDEAIFLEVKKVGASIVLQKAEDQSSEIPAGRGTPKTSWSDPAELTARLARNGGRMGHSIFMQDIAGDLGVDKKTVLRELKGRQDIQWLREGDYWRIPATEEFDL